PCLFYTRFHFSVPLCGFGQSPSNVFWSLNSAACLARAGRSVRCPPRTGHRINPLRVHRELCHGAALLVPAPHGSGLAGQLEVLAGVHDGDALLGLLDLEDGDVAVHEVADVEVLAVGAPHDTFGQAAHFELVELGHLLAIDLEDDHAAVPVVEVRVPRRVAAPQKDDRGQVALRADGQTLGRVAHHHAVD